jgi:spermidine/putrescine transport system permease protein
MAAGRFISEESRRSLILLLPPFLYAVLLMAVPVGAVIAISFTAEGTGGFTLGNYRDVFTDPINVIGMVRGAAEKPDWLPGEFLWGLWTRIIGFFDGSWATGLLLRSLIVSILVTLATVLFAFPIAYFISFHVQPSRKSLWLFLITIPFWTSYLIRIFLWKVILGFSGPVNWLYLELANGPIGRLFGAGDVAAQPLDLLYNVSAVVVTLAHAYAPFAILPIFVALEKIDRSLLEASQDLGESKVTTFFRVTLPLAVPGIVAAVLIVFIPTIGDYVTPELVGGPNGLLIANRIQGLFLQVNQPEIGAALSIVTMAAVAAVSLVFVFLNRRWLRGNAR